MKGSPKLSQGDLHKGLLYGATQNLTHVSPEVSISSGVYTRLIACVKHTY